MNFIGSAEGTEIHIELKYCERCGGLWLRVQGADGVYCAKCRGHLAAAPNPAEATRPLRKRWRKKGAQEESMDVQTGHLQGATRIDCLQGVAATEVWA